MVISAFKYLETNYDAANTDHHHSFSLHKLVMDKLGEAVCTISCRI